MKTIKINRIITLGLLGLLALWQIALAEISGSGSPNFACVGEVAGLLWQDLNADGVADPGEPGLAGVTISLVSDDDENGNALSVTTNAAGLYQFSSLCEGDYLAVVDEATVPDGVFANDPIQDDDDDSSADLGGWHVEIDDDDETSATFDVGYVGCKLAVNASCRVASLASELYSCEKPIDSLSLIWSGQHAIRIVAHYGKSDDEVVADIDNVQPGEPVTIAGFAGSSDDVVWEIFEAGTDTKIGESKFRMNCDDESMDGPEDCGLSQGDGKDDKDDLINDWILDGIVDDSGLLECSNHTVAASTCHSQSTYADCETIDKVNWLTFSFTGGDCDTSNHDQPDKFQCSGEVDSSLPVSVLTDSGDSFMVEPGGSFTIPRDGGDSEIELSNAQGTQTMQIHTSCSKPLAAGDTFGGLTLAALNGLGIGAQIDYEFEIENKGDLAATAFTREAPYRTLLEPVIAINPRSTRTVAGSAYVLRNNIGALLAESNDGINPVCNGADLVDVIIAPRLPCEISGSGWQMDDKDILWDLGTGPGVSATIKKIQIHWPASVSDKLKEIKLNDDKIFDQDRVGGLAVIEKTDLEGDLHKRRIAASDSKQLKFVFDDRIDNLSPDEFQIEVQFSQGCSIVW